LERRRLGRTDLNITPIGIGAWAMGGGDWVFGWGPQDDADSIAAIHHAVDLGINWIDTAAVYGLGHSEIVVARALAELSPSRRPLVFTKCSLVWDEKGAVSHSLEPASLRRELDASLRRLGVETIDLYQVHWPAFPRGGPSPGLEDGWRALADLQRQGKIRHLGASNFDEEHLARVEAVAPVASLQPPYSMVSRGIEARVLPWCQAHEVGVIVYSPMQSGMLSGRMTRERIQALPPDDWRVKFSLEFREPRLTRNLALVERLREFGREHGRSPAEVAIAWTLRHPAVTGAIVGARSPAQVDGFIGAAEWRLTEEEIATIDGWLVS
jgi:aryl-alcohol dehydrogenase-like predicted oxidoreductase